MNKSEESLPGVTILGGEMDGSITVPTDRMQRFYYFLGKQVAYGEVHKALWSLDELANEARDRDPL